MFNKWMLQIYNLQGDIFKKYVESGLQGTHSEPKLCSDHWLRNRCLFFLFVKELG